MSKVYQSIRLGGEDRNAESLGDFVAWLISNNLLDDTLLQKAGSEAARVKMQDLTGAAFLTTVLHGDLKPEHLNDAGKDFCERYLATGDYDRDYQKIDQSEENDWIRFDAISRLISAAFRNLNEPQSALKKAINNVIAFPKRPQPKNQ